MFHLLQRLGDQGQGNWISGVVDATYDLTEPFLRPNPFAGLVLNMNAERAIIKVLRERRVVSKTLPFCGNRLLGSCNNYIKIESKFVLNLLRVLLEGRCKKFSNRRRDPVEKTILTGKVEALSCMEFELRLEKLLGSKVDPRLYLPHVRNMKDVKKLLGMPSIMRFPRATRQKYTVNKYK